MTRRVTARDITDPAKSFAGMPKLLELAWKYARMLGVSVIPKIAFRNDLTSRWLGRYAYTTKPGKVNTIQIQRRVLHDERTLERIMAHEMAHHVDFLTTPPSPRGSQDFAPLRDPHGPSWQAQADKVNRVMGQNFVTELSDESYVLAPETKPYTLLIVKTLKGRLGYQASVHFYPEVVARMSAILKKAIRSTDPRWARAPKIGSRSMALPKNEEETQALLELYGRAERR